MNGNYSSSPIKRGRRDARIEIRVRHKTTLLARPTGFNRGDARNIRIPIEGADVGLVTVGA
jgi:hypothetical protein